MGSNVEARVKLDSFDSLLGAPGVKIPFFERKRKNIKQNF